MILCKGCGAELVDAVGQTPDGDAYAGVTCPNGCDLAALYL